MNTIKFSAQENPWTFPVATISRQGDTFYKGAVIKRPAINMAQGAIMELFKRRNRANGENNDPVGGNFIRQIPSQMSGVWSLLLKKPELKAKSIRKIVKNCK